MSNKIILLLVNFLFFQHIGISKELDKIKILVINIMTGNKVEFEHKLFIDLNNEQITRNKFIERDLFTDIADEKIVKLNLNLYDCEFDCEISVKMLRATSKLIYKLNFNSSVKTNKIYYTNPSGETLLQEFGNNKASPSNYQSLEILNEVFDSGFIDNTDLDWLFTYDGNYSSINGNYKINVYKDEFINIGLKDSTSLTISIKSKIGNTKEEIKGTWIYKENLKAIWIYTSDPITFNLNGQEKINLNSCSFQLTENDELAVCRYTVENGKIKEQELVKVNKE